MSHSKHNPAINVYVPPNPNELMILSSRPVNNAAKRHRIKLTQLADPLPLLGYKSTNIVVQIPINTEAENETKIVDIMMEIICRLYCIHHPKITKPIIINVVGTTVNVNLVEIILNGGRPSMGRFSTC